MNKKYINIKDFVEKLFPVAFEIKDTCGTHVTFNDGLITIYYGNDGGPTFNLNLDHYGKYGIHCKKDKRYATIVARSLEELEERLYDLCISTSGGNIQIAQMLERAFNFTKIYRFATKSKSTLILSLNPDPEEIHKSKKFYAIDSFNE